jgi:hypothetical protein
VKKAEIIIAAVSIIAMGLKLLLVPGSGILTVLSLSILSVYYMYLSFAIFNRIRPKNFYKKDSYLGISKMRIIGAIGTGLALSITTIGILFKFQSWPGGSFNLGVGLLGLFIVTIIGLIRFNRNKSDYYKGIFKRVAIVGILGLILMLIPQTTWIEIKYRNHPTYIEALKRAMADPENKDLWQNVEIERQKMKQEK